MRKKHRRVRTEPAPGSDPRPQQDSPGPVVAGEDRDDGWGGGAPPATGNEDFLKRERPPHW